MSNSTAFLTLQTTRILDTLYVSFSATCLHSAISFRVNRGLSLDGVVGGALAECLINEDYSTDFINDLIDEVLASVRIASLNRSL